MQEKFLTSKDSAKILDLSPDMIRWMARHGVLRAALIVGRGQRLFSAKEVERLRAEREKAATK